jgi:hypothetical protein
MTIPIKLLSIIGILTLITCTKTYTKQITLKFLSSEDATWIHPYIFTVDSLDFIQLQKTSKSTLNVQAGIDDKGNLILADPSAHFSWIPSRSKFIGDTNTLFFDGKNSSLIILLQYESSSVPPLGTIGLAHHPKRKINTMINQ